MKEEENGEGGVREEEARGSVSKAHKGEKSSKWRRRGIVVERLARPHLVRLVQQGKPFPDYLINRLLIWKQRKPQKLKQFIINITPTKGLHCNQSCKHAQSRS